MKQFVAGVAFPALFLCSMASALVHIPKLRLNNGVEMPMGGIGTWLYNDSRAGAAVELALSLGYDMIDTAYDYENQVGIGAAIQKSGRARESIFITTKIEGGLSFDDTLAEAEKNLKDLNTTYVDLLLTHYPTTMEAHPKGSKAMRQEQWKALEKFHLSGKARAIGVSHFCRRHLEDVLETAVVKPALNQVQYHVGMGSAGPNATDDKDFMEEKGIQFASFSPLCGPCETFELLNGTMVTSIGKNHGKSGAQVSLRWLVQQGIPVVPKSDKKKHLIENMDLFDWALSDDEMKTLSAATKPPVAGPGDGTSGDCPLP